MSERASRTLAWTARLLAVLVSLFLGTFALDALEHERGFWASLPPFLVHLIPAFMLLGTVFVAWRRPGFGALIFLSFAAIYAVGTLARPDWALTIAGPLALAGILYLVTWRAALASGRPGAT